MMTRATGWLAALVILCMSTANAIQVDPTRLILKLDPGETYEGSIQLINAAEAPVGIQVTVQDETRNNPTITSTWYAVSAEDITVPATSSLNFPFSIQVPLQAEGEMHLRVAFAEKRPMEDAPVTLIPVFAVPIYIQVKNTERYEPVLHDLQVKSNDPLTIGMIVENRGNVQIRPIALCKITRKDTKELASVLYINKQNSNDIGWPIFPKRREMVTGRVSESSAYPKNLEPGEYTLEAAFEINGQEYKKTVDIRIP